MGKKATKATKKFAASGQLKKQIQTRHKQQQIKRKVQGRRGGKGTKGAVTRDEGSSGEEDEEHPVKKKGKRWDCCLACCFC
jgi:nucleolar complex protein 2